MSVAVPSDETLREVALTRAEYHSIVEQLGREPNDLELGMFGVLWSEHCSYKTSRPLLRRFPSGGERVLQGPGENAGVVDIGHGLAVAFKVESHNHPSAIEPYQGAATGVGGILRDVIAMGARPVALLDSLRFGPLPGSRRHLEGVVAGVGGYGNCMGIPTVGGEIYFDESYRGNPLVNAMCVGVVRQDQLKRAGTGRTGDSLILAGAPAGRDGIHAASFASLELDESSEERRPAVQVGNPFMEKCLLEACQEALDLEGVRAVQDLGAAGLTSAVAECAAKAEAGARIDIDRVPRRERGMTPYEVMLSESQERMLLVVEPGWEDRVRAVFDRWDLEAVRIGGVTGDGRLQIVEDGREAAAVPVRVLADGAPLRHPDSRAPEPVPAPPSPEPVEDLAGTLVRLLAGPNLCSRRPVFRRYDHMVGNATLLPPGGDAAVLRVAGTPVALAMTIDGNGRYCRLDPLIGAEIAVCEAARNIVATGAAPLAVTDCLNFGNPDRPEVFWQLERAVDGISRACETLGLPVVSGNVSLYNESEQGAIDPTPVIGMVGLLEDASRRVPQALQAEGDFVLLVGENGGGLEGSELAAQEHGHRTGPPPVLDLLKEQAVQDLVLQAARRGLLRSAHDVAEGGLLVALAECCVWGGIGVRCSALQAEGEVRQDAVFFGEAQSRFVVSATSHGLPELQSLARGLKVDLTLLGLAGGDRLEFDGQLSVPLDELQEAWDRGLEADA